MIKIIHSNSQKLVKVLQNEEELEVKSTSCTNVLWELAERFQEEWIAWVEQDLLDQVDFSNWKNIFHHDLIMASYALKTEFLPPAIGFIDQSPFINVNKDVLYPTWQMSSNVGGVNAAVLLKVKPQFFKIKNFDFLLNSIAKLGQQNGLFCYSAPSLVVKPTKEEVKYKASIGDLFLFVSQHYNRPWVWVLFWCYIKYKNHFPVFALLRSLFAKSYFQNEIDFSEIKIESKKEKNTSTSETIAVIIPTMGRAEHLLQVLEDLSQQSLLPKKIIVVEQNPDPNATSDFDFSAREYPFEIVHRFIHQTGACNARNLALQEVNEEWVFLLDDDVRIKPTVLEKLMEEARRFGAECISISCLQEHEKKLFHKIKQWGTFGSGTSIVKRRVIQDLRFSMVFEHGFGEDMDFGMQIRNRGVDVLYHPYIEILHLKAPMGGFRQKFMKDWEQEKPLPKPSPTVMAFAMRYYTAEQFTGYKTSLFIKFYNKQNIKNPVAYIKHMKMRWNQSEKWARKLLHDHKDEW